MALAVLLTATLVSLALMPTPYVAESSAELYWKTKLGNDTTMPKFLKDGLLDVDETDAVRQIIHKGFVLSDQQEASIRRVVEIIYYNKVSKLTDEHDPINQHSTFFTVEDITLPKKTMKLHFAANVDDTKFMPAHVSNKIPFTTSKLANILSLFSVRPKSTPALIMEETIKRCETRTTMKGETKSCALTLEGMVDYAISQVGNKVSVVYAGVDKDIENEYRVESAKKLGSDANMVCHKMGYPYAVFYCHRLSNTDMYSVTFVGKDRNDKADVVAVCHKDTYTWSPSHTAFKILGVKPGVPICHFLNERSIAWVPK